MTVDIHPHNVEVSRTSLPHIRIINTTTGTERPFNGSIKELLEQSPEYRNAKIVLHAGTFGIYMCVYEPGCKVPD